MIGSRLPPRTEIADRPTGARNARARLREMNPEVGADLQVAGRRRDVDHAWRDQLAIRRVLDLQQRAPGEDGRKRTHVVWIEVLHDHDGKRKLCGSRARSDVRADSPPADAAIATR